jgi:inosine/xanthosine triphosphate pyrophosphatase family protein
MEEVIDLIDLDGHRTTVLRQQENYSSFRSEIESVMAYLLPIKGRILDYLPITLKRDPRIWFATGNYGKVLEFKGFIENSGHLKELLDGLLEFDVPKVPLPEVDETGSTLYANSVLKSTQTAAHLSSYVMAEDSGICVPLLGDEPGVYSARYFDRNIGRYNPESFVDAGIIYHEILSEEGKPESVKTKDAKDFLNKVMLLTRVMSVVGKHGEVPAYFQTVATIAEPSGKIAASGIGTLFGEVVVPNGFSLNDRESLRALHRDFGYNSIFFVNGKSKDEEQFCSLSDVSISERLKWNHRSIAMTRAIIDLLIKLA